MATLTSLISSIRSTSSGPTMREKIALAFEGTRDGFTTETVTSTKTVAAETVATGSVSVSLSGYTAIGVIQTKASNSNAIISNCYISGSTLYYTVENKSSSSVSNTATFTVLYKNSNMA